MASLASASAKYRFLPEKHLAACVALSMPKNSNSIDDLAPDSDARNARLPSALTLLYQWRMYFVRASSMPWFVFLPLSHAPRSSAPERRRGNSIPNLMRASLMGLHMRQSRGRERCHIEQHFFRGKHLMNMMAFSSGRCMWKSLYALSPSPRFRPYRGKRNFPEHMSCIDTHSLLHPFSHESSMKRN